MVQMKGRHTLSMYTYPRYPLYLERKHHPKENKDATAKTPKVTDANLRYWLPLCGNVDVKKNTDSTVGLTNINT